MAGAALEVAIDSAQLRQLQERLERLAGVFDSPGELLDALGATVASQAQRRIAGEKTSPIGEVWPDWSDAYALTRHAGHSPLRGEGDLLESIQHAVDGDVAEIGTPLAYGAIHQFGGTSDMAPGPAAVPAREYLGLGPDSLAELDAIVDSWLEERSGEALA